MSATTIGVAWSIEDLKRGLVHIQVGSEHADLSPTEAQLIALQILEAAAQADIGSTLLAWFGLRMQMPAANLPSVLADFRLFQREGRFADEEQGEG